MMSPMLLSLQTPILSEDTEEDAPFKILNSDGLQMTILGERIFKPFGSNNKRKPDGIVYPTRRVDLSFQQINQQKHLTKSNGQLDDNYNTNATSKKLSGSHGNLHTDNFTLNLDAKLRRLQNEKDNNSKKPFITTVKKGTFLEPPEPKPKKNGEDVSRKSKTPKKELYAYVSKPMILSRSPPQNVHRSRCEAAIIAAGLTKIKGGKNEDAVDHPEGRKKREAVIPENKDAQKNEMPKWNPYFAYARLLSQEQSKIEETRKQKAKRRSIARKKARIQSSLDTSLKVAEIQTDTYLQASLVKPPIIDTNTQTEDDIQKETHHQDTQIVPGDLFDFEEEIQPILEVLVGKTIESALIEVLEEEELATLKGQQRKYLDMKEEEERAVESRLVDEISRKGDRPPVFLEKYLLKLIPPVLEELKSEGAYIEDETLHNGNLLPWLMEEVLMELGDILSSGNFLLEIVRDVMNRKTELAKVMKQTID